MSHCRHPLLTRFQVVVAAWRVHPESSSAANLGCLGAVQAPGFDTCPTSALVRFFTQASRAAGYTLPAAALCLPAVTGFVIAVGTQAFKSATGEEPLTLLGAVCYVAEVVYYLPGRAAILLLLSFTPACRLASTSRQSGTASHPPSAPLRPPSELPGSCSASGWRSHTSAALSCAGKRRQPSASDRPCPVSWAQLLCCA